MMMQIGAVAKQCGIGVETVRYYEREGLIDKPRRSISGYRQYTEMVLQQIQFIQYAKSVGFTLKDIRELRKLKNTTGMTCQTACLKAMDKVNEIQQKIAALEKMQTTLLSLVEECPPHATMADCPVLQPFEIDCDTTNTALKRGKKL